LRREVSIVLLPTVSDLPLAGEKRRTWFSIQFPHRSEARTLAKNSEQMTTKENSRSLPLRARSVAQKLPQDGYWNTIGRACKFDLSYESEVFLRFERTPPLRQRPRPAAQPIERGSRVTRASTHHHRRRKPCRLLPSSLRWSIPNEDRFLRLSLIWAREMR
jgi:hypothetical protein